MINGDFLNFEQVYLYINHMILNILIIILNPKLKKN